MIDKKRVGIVGFDLDGTLYPLTDNINDRIRDLMAEKILEVKPFLGSLISARSYFDMSYNDLGSGSAVLREAGVQDPEGVRNWSIANAKVEDLLERDEELALTLKDLAERFPLYLLTSSPEEASLRKLNALGISPAVFSYMFCGDSVGTGPKTNGDVFDYAVRNSGKEAVNHLYVGDSLRSDILPAGSRGMQTIYVGGECHKADLSIANIHCVGGVLL